MYCVDILSVLIVTLLIVTLLLTSDPVGVWQACVYIRSPAFVKYEIFMKIGWDLTKLLSWA